MSVLPPKTYPTFCPLWVCLVVWCLLPAPLRASAAAPTPAPRFLMAHYLPWYQAKPFSPQWGWHWTMDHFHPERTVDGQPEIASHFHPLIGPYDSADPDAVQCQVLLMKLAGIDGVIIDWYGIDNYHDYGVINRNTALLIGVIQKAHMRFAVCYEDQSVPQEIAGGVFPASEALAQGQRLMQSMQQRFFASPASLTLGGRPVLLSFGEPFYQARQWEQMFSLLPRQPVYLTETVRRAGAASAGAFDWPLPGGGTTRALAAQETFCRAAGGQIPSIPVAFPRFQDIYQEAHVGKSYGAIDDRAGQTYTDTLASALRSPAQIVQIATWNDWGEGTQIEPSQEFGCRDLIATQRVRRQVWGTGRGGSPADLQLIIAWYLLCRKEAGNPRLHARLAAFFPLVVGGHMKQARALVAACEAAAQARS